MRIKRLAAFATAFLLVALALQITAVAADQLSGTWKVNLAKSKYSPGPAPKSLTVKIEADENNIKLASINFSSPTLDDVFLHHTGKRIRVEELGKMPDRVAFGMRGR